MSRENKDTVIVGLLIIIIGLLVSILINIKTDKRNGRYQITASDRCIYVLDTRTGQLWKRYPYLSTNWGTNHKAIRALKILPISSNNSGFRKWAIDAGLSKDSTYGKSPLYSAVSLHNTRKNSEYYLKNAGWFDSRDFWEFEGKVMDGIIKYNPEEDPELDGKIMQKYPSYYLNKVPMSFEMMILNP